MTKEQKDLAWACLPKETRDKVKFDFRQEFYPVRNYLIDIFGFHNLTSDTEPEEVLMVSRKEVQDRVKTFSNPNWASNEEETYGAQLVIDTLDLLFGDKCLPDKELNEDNFAKSKPKFSKGDLVRFKDSYYKEEMCGKVGSIYTIRTNAEYYVEVDNTLYCAKESKLEPYTEEKAPIVSAHGTKDEAINDTKETMKEKGLNLAELLKGCIGEWFYVMPCGEMELKGINKLELKPLRFSKGAINCLTKTDGRAYENGCCIIYPSRTLYEKYPLDPYSAWMEWKEERKTKRWRAKSSAGVAVSECDSHWEDYTYWYITSDGVIAQDEETNCKADNLRYNIGNYFRTEEEAQQAAEAVCETLAKLYEQKPTP